MEVLRRALSEGEKEISELVDITAGQNHDKQAGQKIRATENGVDIPLVQNQGSKDMSDITQGQQLLKSQGKHLTKWS